MSIWKSPVLYLGILLVLAVVGALAAPFIVNWNGYRNDLEGWGHRLTGREVAINGPISVRLFPWPQLVARDVSLANPQGFSEQAMLQAKRVNVQLSLDGLFSGEIRVEGIDIENPVITIARNAGGAGNWNFQPDEVLRNSHLLEKVKLEQIKLIEGSLTLRDNARNFEMVFQHFNAILSAGALEGPWRVKGTAQRGDLPLDLTFTSSAWKSDEPFKFGFRVAPSDGSLPALVFDGAENDASWQGKLRLEQVVTDDGRQSLDNNFKPLQMQAEVDASFNHVKLDKIHIVPADTKDSGTLIEGTADIALEQGIKADVSLNSPRVDLDSLVGGQSLRVWRAGGVMAMLNSVIADFPEKLDLNAVLDVASLSAAGETLENVKLKTSAQQGAIRIQNFSASLPGRSAMKFDGIVFPGDVAAELGGTLAMESNDTRAFVSWLWPEGKDKLSKFWTGARGRLKAQSDVTWSGKRFGFQNLKYELDGEPGTAELAVSLGKLPSVDLKVNAKSVDLDNYLASGFAGAWGLAGYPGLGQSDGTFDKRLGLTADKLRLNGVEAQTVAIDFSSSFSGFEVKRLELGSVEGAKVSGSGLVLQGPDGASGDLKLSVQADNPRGLLRLVGAFPKGPDPAWADVLGRTNLQTDVNVRPGGKEPKITIGSTGSSGPLQISASGDITNFSMGVDAGLGLSVDIAAGDAADLVRLVGVPSHIAGVGEGKISLTATGSKPDGFKSSFHAQGFGAALDFDGMAGWGEGLLKLDGAASLTAAESHRLAEGMGLAHVAVLAGPIDVKAKLSSAEHKISITGIAGKMAGQAVSGDASVGADGMININLAMDTLDLKSVLAGVFMPWRNQSPAADDSFAGPGAAGWRGEIWLRPTALDNGLGAINAETVIGIEFEPASRGISLVSQTPDREPFKLDVTVKQDSNSFAVSGSGHGEVALAPLLITQTGEKFGKGTLVLDGNFEGRGRSPLAAMSVLSGIGTYQLYDAQLNTLSPDPLYKKLGEVKDAAALQQAFDELLQGPGFAIDANKQPLSIAKGVVTAAPHTVQTTFAMATIAPSFDLSAGELKAEIQLAAKAQKDLPDIRVSYEGQPGQMVRRSDTAAISSKLGFALIAKDVAELDRVKAEQEKLAADEAVQAQADAEKFAAYQAQRAELRLRLRELKVFAAQRVIDEAQTKADWEKLMGVSQIITKQELPRLLQQLPVH